MKTMQVFFLAGTVLLGACTNHMNEVMSADDIAALQAMEQAYYAAGAYNDSLAAYVDTTGITDDEMCYYFDDMYHYHDSLFAIHHDMYSHSYSGDDHGKSSWQMGSGWAGGGHGQMGHMNGVVFNSSYCTDANLDLMDSLMVAHEGYHPGN